VTWTKICGITSEADALLCVGLGADAIGVIFAPSHRQVTVQLAQDIIRRVPEETTVVGVFRDESPVRVVEIANRIGLRAVQLHGSEPRSEVSYVAERIPLVIKAFPAGSPLVSHFAAYGAGLLLLDGPNPGSGQIFDWRLAEGVADADRMVLSGGLDPENVVGAIEQIHPYGVDVASGVESAPGIKDPLRVRAFLEAVRSVPGAPHLADDDGGAPFDWSNR
jgi:phosphoribosylanthranilate isomerase